MPAELTAESTHDDIQEYVDQIVQDVAGEQSEQKTDSQQVAEDHDIPVVAETNTGDDAPVETGEKTGDSEDQAEDWLDDDLKAEVAAYGIDEKKLADFRSREEVERALRFFDRSALEAGRRALAEGEETERVRDERGRFIKAKEEEPESKAKEGQFEITLDTDVYDEGLVGELTRMRDHYESRIDALESRFAENESNAEEQRFDAFVDVLDMPHLFGKTGKENAKQLQAREDLLIASKAQQIGLRSYGRDVDFDQSLVNRVARMVHSDEFTKKELKARTRKISKQSDGRMGDSATKAQAQKEPLMEEMKRLYKELEDT